MVTEDEAVESEDKKESVQEDKDPPPPFYWMQGMEDIVIWVELPKKTNKREIKAGFFVQL